MSPQPVQRWHPVNGVWTRRGHQSIVPPASKAAGQLARAELDAIVAVRGQLSRAELRALTAINGQLSRAELSIPTQANITSVPLSFYRQPGDTFETALTRIPAGADIILDLEGQTGTFSDFDQGFKDGLYTPPVIGYVNGQLQMVPNSSTHAAAVNALPSGAVCNETLLRLGYGSSKPTQAYFGDMIVQATPQGHIYNGIVLNLCHDSIVENCQFLGIPGSGGAPPGETTCLNNFKSARTTIRNVFCDAQHVGSSLMLNSSCTDVLIQNSTFQNSQYGAGIPAYQTNNLTSQNNYFANNHGAGLSMEKCTGTITSDHDTFTNNGHNIIVDTDGASALVNIIDPTWDGMNSGVPFKVLIHKFYAYPPVANPPLNAQHASDVHMFQNGVEVTSDPTKLQIITA